MLIVYTGIKGIKYFYTMGNTGSTLKKNVLLAGHFFKALTPSPHQLAEQQRFYAIFFFYMDICIHVLKPNSDRKME